MHTGIILELKAELGGRPWPQLIRLALSWNVNSLGPPKSQRTFINKIRGMKFNVVFLLDTRLGKEDEEQFEKMWGGKVFTF